MRLRQGRKVPRNLYLHSGDDPGGDGRDVGRVDHAGLAEVLTVLFNRYRPDCLLLCRPGCEHGEAHCKWRHLPAFTAGWHDEAGCPWEALRSGTATTGEGDG